MALAPSLTTVTVSGTYINFEGTPIEGQIRFSTTDVLRNGTDDQLVAPTTVVVPLVNGSFSVTLPATNDPDIFPNPFVYTVEESFSNGRVYTITLPYTSSGTLDLADLSPGPVLTNNYVGLIDSVTWAAMVANINALDVVVNQSTGKVDAQTYWLIPYTYATYTAFNAAYATYTAMNAAIYAIGPTEISSITGAAQTSAANALNYANLTASRAAATINPLMLLGGTN